MSAKEIVPSPRLRWPTKLAYGAGDLGAAIVATINGFFLSAFLLDVAGLRPGAAGTIFLLVKIWDSVNDPLIGTLTDRTKTRWGRRRPWLLFGALPFGLAFFLQWLVPDLGPVGKFWYYLLVALLLDTAFTAVNVPYTAMTPDLARDYDERTSLNAYRFSFSILGATLAGAVHAEILDRSVDAASGYLTGAALWAVVIVASSIITFIFTRESETAPAGEDPGFLEGLRIVFKNRAFLYVTTIYLLAWLSIQFVQANLLLYVRYWADAEASFTFLILAVQLSAFVCLLFWTRVSARIGKQQTYFAGMGFWIAVSIALFFVQPGQITLLFVLAILAGVGVSVGYLIPWSMLPDVIEADELETGQRREGLYYGFFVFLQKLGVSLGLALSLYALELTGYITPASAAESVTQPANVQLALRLFVSIVPAIILLLSFPVVHRYPITRDRHAAMRARLAERRAAAD